MGEFILTLIGVFIEFSVLAVILRYIAISLNHPIGFWLAFVIVLFVRAILPNSKGK